MNYENAYQKFILQIFLCIDAIFDHEAMTKHTNVNLSPSVQYFVFKSRAGDPREHFINIATGTTDLEIDSVTKFSNHMAAFGFALVSNFAIRWQHLHSLHIWPPDDTTCIPHKIGDSPNGLLYLNKVEENFE